ncbi:MAG: hypothetical protein BWK80_11860 [Desulfobacteraceae bacterium IS3]|nr:MAG: hypothetical protein BWK80_11860 [Desulfobacteraceae bacterium IS3]
MALRLNSYFLKKIRVLLFVENSCSFVDKNLTAITFQIFKDNMYPTLPKSYKHAYPFKIGTTSFVYPAGYVPNVKMLAPYVDEIELLLFESAKESLPTISEIKTLSLLAKDFDLSYNVHLPTDISIVSHDAAVADAAAEALRRVIDLTSCLSPSTFTLHLPYHETSAEAADVKTWQELARRGIARLLNTTGIKSETISVETLNYPFEWAEDVINEFHLSICIDIGHLIVYKRLFNLAFDRYSEKTSILHVHGVKENRDHLALNHITEKDLHFFMDILQRFKQVVSLEVFSYNDLKNSLIFLEKCWQRGKDRKT